MGFTKLETILCPGKLIIINQFEWLIFLYGFSARLSVSFLKLTGEIRNALLIALSPRHYLKNETTEGLISCIETISRSHTSLSKVWIFPTVSWIIRTLVLIGKLYYLFHLFTLFTFFPTGIWGSKKRFLMLSKTWILVGLINRIRMLGRGGPHSMVTLKTYLA